MTSINPAPVQVVVGIVTRNRREYLEKAINSALTQKDVNVVVSVFVDDSDDDTISLRDNYSEVKWEFSSVNRGYVFARNKIMREAAADYYCSLDDDSWFTTPVDLAQAIVYLNSHPDVAGVAFDILSPDRPVRQAIGSPVETANFIGCGHVLRLRHVQEVNYYDPNPSSYGGEEKDLSIKLMDKGYKIVRLPGVHVWHDKTVVARDLKAQHRSGVCNDLVFAYRRTPSRLLLLALVAKIWGHIRFAIRYQRGIFLLPCLRAISDFGRVLLTSRIERMPVSTATLRKFIRLSQA